MRYVVVQQRDMSLLIEAESADAALKIAKATPIDAFNALRHDWRVWQAASGVLERCEEWDIWKQPNESKRTCLSGRYDK